MRNKIINAPNTDSKGLLIQCLIASFIALVVSLVFACILAVVLLINPLLENIIPIVSQCLKYLCAIIAAVIACKNRNTLGYFRGALAGFGFFAISFIIYGIFNQNFIMNVTSLIDMVICCILGLLCGAISVNINSRRK